MGSKGRIGSGFGTAVVVAALLVHTVSAQTPQTTFRTTVEVTSLDATVVDDRGKPLINLVPGEFLVRIDGNARKVVSAEWIPLSTGPEKPPPPAPPEGYSSNESSTGGRLIVVAVDEPNIRFGGAMAIARTANAFIDRLMPSDRVAVAGFGPGAPSTPFTGDRERVKRAISRMVGQKQRTGRISDFAQHNIALVEAQAIDRGDYATLDVVQKRECQGLTGFQLEFCAQQIVTDAHSIAYEARIEGDTTIQNLRDLFLGLSRIDAPKTLILISEGFVLSDEPMVIELGRLAAQARTSVYALKLDTPMFDAGDSRMPLQPFADNRARTEGLDMLAGAARGTLFNVVGTADSLFARIESELSGYYLLGVESDPRDHDGKTHSVRIDVSRRAAIVRSRREVLDARAEKPTARTPRAAVLAALSSPLVLSALPLRVASFPLQGPDASKIQMLIHADIGADYTASKAVAVAFVITDKEGRQVDTRSEATRVSPLVTGVPSALRYTTGASLGPGDYSLKLAVADGEHVGTIEHTIHATLPAAGDLKLSELMVGGPAEVGELLTPTIGYEVTVGIVHGYLEAYGSKADSVTMEYEIAADPAAPALLNVDVPARPAGDLRRIFTRVVQIHQLPPGKYVLRAIASSGGRSIKTLTRPFEVAAPKVVMASVDGVGATPTEPELFLPVDDAVMAPVFRREEATSAEILKVFAERLDETVKPAFDEGLTAFKAGEYAKAEVSFKRGIRPEVDSTAALVYLAACFAASGHDPEAASAWQTALVDGSDVPEIYQWLGGAMMRNHQLAEARAILEEALQKWPSDSRFAKPLAMLYGAFGRGREAVHTLERYLDEREDDRDALYFVVQWLYTVHSSGASVHNPAEDARLARLYANAYEKAGGPKAPLVKQWVEYLEGELKKR